MYTVYCDGTKIYDLYTDLHLIEPVLELELNSPGTFEFTMPADHPYFDLPKKMLSRVTVEHDDEEVFRGRIIQEEIDFYNQKKIYCEGELAFLNDSIQRPGEYHDMTIRQYFQTLIESHNSQVEEDKQFAIGDVEVMDEDTTVYRYTNYNSTLEELKDDLIENYGGYLRVRNQGGVRYLDYIPIEEYGDTIDQVIRFGVNLLDYTQTMDLTDIATVIIPLGERLEESPIEALDMRLTIESVNGGSDAIESDEAVKTYGRIVKTIIWDDVTVASNLLEKGKKYLSDYQWDPLVLEVTPVDLHDTDADTETFHLGDQIRVISSPHGLDRYFPLSAMTIHLDSLDQNTFTLGTELAGKTLTSNIRQSLYEAIEKNITPTQDILNEAKKQATALINSATHGYVVVEPEEILIMDQPNKEDAQCLWRWNLNGLGYSPNGYEGTYETAITMQGAIVADFITTGQLTANVIKTGKIQDVPGNNCWDMDNGTLVVNTKQFTLDEKGNATFSGDLSAAKGTFTSLYTGSHSKYSSTANGFYAGDEGISLGTYFKVSNAGVLECGSGTFSGILQCLDSYDRGLVVKYGEMDFYESFSSNDITASFKLIENGNYDNDDITITSYLSNGVKISSNTSSEDFVNGANRRSYGFDISSSGNATYSINMRGTVYCNSSFYVAGTKSRVIATEHYGDVALYSFETASPTFADSGSGTIGEDGEISIFIDPEFYETILSSAYQVFVTPTSKGVINWVEKQDGFFNVYGDDGATFDWIIMALQRDVSAIRMERLAEY